MKTILRWSKGVFSSSYKIYSNGKQIGSMKDKSFSQSATGFLNGKEYTFKTNGFFRQTTDIVDSSDHKVIGKIEYSNWMTKATILLNGKTFNWKYDNIWNTKWSIFDSEGILISFNGSSTSGSIDSNTDETPLILSGLFVTNYYLQMSAAVLLVVFIPIFL